MKPIKELTTVAEIRDFDKDNVIIYFEDARSTIADKKTFCEIYDNIYYSNWKTFNEVFYLAQSNSMWTLVYKNTGKPLNEALWFSEIESFDEEFFIITSAENYLMTLVYKKNGEFFNSDIWGDYWEKFSDKFLKIYNNQGTESVFNIVNKKQKKLLSKDYFLEIYNFDQNLFVVKKLNDSEHYTFVKKKNGECLKENLFFHHWLNLNDNFCLIRIDRHYVFIKKSDGTIADDFPIIKDFYYFDFVDEKNEEASEFFMIAFENESELNRAILRKADCSISPLYFNIRPFNDKYFEAYLDEEHLTLVKKSDFSLVCNYLCVHKNDIKAYTDSEYFSIKKDDGTISLYK